MVDPIVEGRALHMLARAYQPHIEANLGEAHSQTAQCPVVPIAKHLAASPGLMSQRSKSPREESPEVSTPAEIFAKAEKLGVSLPSDGIRQGKRPKRLADAPSSSVQDVSEDIDQVTHLSVALSQKL